jgi:hypothetical protein
MNVMIFIKSSPKGIKGEIFILAFATSHRTGHEQTKGSLRCYAGREGKTQFMQGLLVQLEVGPYPNGKKDFSLRSK